MNNHLLEENEPKQGLELTCADGHDSTQQGYFSTLGRSQKPSVELLKIGCFSTERFNLANIVFINLVSTLTRVIINHGGVETARLKINLGGPHRG